MTDPFDNLDFEELIKPEHWTETNGLHTSTLDAFLSEQAQTLTLMFAGGHKETIPRSAIEALTRYLMEYAHVAPLQVYEDVPTHFHPQRVDE